MPRLTRQEVQWISHALQQRKDKIRLTVGWQKIYQKFPCGRQDSGWLYLNLADRDLLREITRSDTGVDPLEKTRLGNRTALADQLVDEKWSHESVQAQRIYCHSYLAPLVVKGESITLPGGSSLWLDYADLMLSAYQAVVLVENLEAFIYWHDFNLPAELGPSLVVYRGHDGSATAAKQFFASLPENLQRVVFTDPDPAGVAIMLAVAGATHGLVVADVMALKAVTHQQRFAQQLDKYSRLGEQTRRGSKSLQGYWQAIFSAGIATSQERLCKGGLPLQLINLLA